jgi:DNA-binding NarL/FixJ family response regulator
VNKVTARRIFVFWIHPIFRDAIQALLTHPEIEWAGESSDYAEGVHALQNNQADAILVEEDDGQVPGEIMDILEKSRQNVRIIRLNIQDNQMWIYRRVQHTVSKAQDLLEMILDDSL